jgi:hypothetical protein
LNYLHKHICEAVYTTYTYEETEINVTKRNKSTLNGKSCSCPCATPCLSKRTDTVLKTFNLAPTRRLWIFTDVDFSALFSVIAV